jgi:signal transduction histidine kinase
VESILSLSKFDSAVGELPNESVSLNQVVDSALFTMGPAIDKSDIQVSLKSDSELLVRGDVGQLSQVFINLIANAVKFSQPGSEIRIELARGARAVVTVSDSGIGVPEADLPHLFTRFFRASNVPTSKYQGTGLGLAIVQQVINHHGGTIEVQSELGQGSTFIVEFPLFKGEINE